MLHSGSRGVGNAIGTMFIELAKKDTLRNSATCPTRISRTSRRAELLRRLRARRRLGAGVRAANREVMMKRRDRGREDGDRKPFQSHVEAVNCHHNYVQKEQHYGQDVYVTRKGAVACRRRAGDHPRQHGCAQLHRARQGKPRELRELQPRSRPRDVAARPSASSRSRTTAGDRGHRVPQGPGRDRRNARGLQGHRRRDGGAEAISSRSCTPSAGGLREGLAGAVL